MGCNSGIQIGSKAAELPRMPLSTSPSPSTVGITRVIIFFYLQAEYFSKKQVPSEHRLLSYQYLYLFVILHFW